MITAVLFCNGSRGSYPGYLTIQTDGCQIPQRSDNPRLGENLLLRVVIMRIVVGLAAVEGVLRWISPLVV
jgi:hypothetical protein